MANRRDINRWKRNQSESGYWNEWAEGRMKAKEKLEKERKWAVDEHGNAANMETKRWMDSASVNFFEHVFEEAVDFSGCLFPWTVDFGQAKFKFERGTSFGDAIFSGPVRFGGAEFSGTAGFNDATFSGPASFEGARFCRDARFNRATFSGPAIFDGAIFAWDAEFNGANFSRTATVEFRPEEFCGHAWFNDATFSGIAVFSGFTFSRDALFNGAKFLRGVEFSQVTFSGDVWFDDARFSWVVFLSVIFSGSYGNTRFRDAEFSEPVEFSQVTFSNDANFSMVHFRKGAQFNNKVTFSRNVWFDQCNFEGATDFRGAEFARDASFNAATSDGAFSLADAQFAGVPDFIQMSFRVPVRLDNLRVDKERRSQKVDGWERAARYRALKKIAIESHDHFREQDFFASEVKARRGTDDPVWGARWGFGLAYELFSDFGRSISRPLIALAALSIVFTFIYVLTRDLRASLNCGPDGMLPICKAAYLSFVNSMPFIGLGMTEQIKQISNCLYGTDVLPLGITVWTTVQTVLSTVLFFLFLLAVRNHFRIK